MNSSEFNADDLLTEINKSILTKGIVIALIAHAVIVFGTSFSLYRDWAEYGIKAPATIKVEKKAKQVAEEKARREAEIQRKAAEASTNAAPASATAPATKDGAVKDAAAKDGAKGAKAEPAAPEAKDGAAPAKDGKNAKPPELEPLKRATTDEVSLDDIGL